MLVDQLILVAMPPRILSSHIIAMLKPYILTVEDISLNPDFLHVQDRVSFIVSSPDPTLEKGRGSGALRLNPHKASKAWI